MRAEQLDKCKNVLFTIGEITGQVKLQDCLEEDLEKESKAAFRQAEALVRKFQCDAKVDGYILSKDIVYKVYVVNTRTEKITGQEAKEIKRKFKQFQSQPEEAVA